MELLVKKRVPILKLVVHFFQKRTLFIVSDPDRTEILKYLQTLHQLSQEYIIDDMAQRIETNIYLQSLSIQSLEHAFDILETVDVITPSKDFRVKDVRDNCARYFMEMLTGYEVLDESLRKRQFSLASITMLRGILLENLMDSIRDGLGDDEQVKVAIYRLARDFQSAQ